MSVLEAAEEINARGGFTRHNFEAISERGFGDQLNSYAHSMAWYKDHLYVGTTRGHLFQLMAGIRVIPDLYPKTMVYPIEVPENHFDVDLRAQIWRFNPKNGEWKKVYQTPYVEGTDGSQVPLSMGFRIMRVFQGESDPEPALYTISLAPSKRPEAIMLRCIDGENFELVSEPGLGITDPVPRSLRTLIPFEGRLFTSPVMGQERGQTCTFGRASVYVSSDPAKGKWQLASPPSFGNPNNLAVFTMGLYANQVFAGTTNIQEGFELWKTDAQGEPPFKWTRVITQGGYRGKYNQIGGIVGYLGNCAYICTGIQSGGYDRKFKVGPAAPEVLRIWPDDSWDLVVGEPRETPDGLKVPLSGMGPGFNRLSNGYFWYGYPHEDYLYIGTFNWATFTLFTKLDMLPKQHAAGMEAFQRYVRRNGGFSIWRSADGVNWEAVTRNGFGNYWDTGIRTMISTPAGLFLGTLGSFGPEVATKRVAGWRYEHNPDCGLQIYRGNPAKPVEDKEEPSWELRKSSLSKKIAGSNGDSLAAIETVMDDYYEGSDFRHVGFWREDITTVQKACENLMQEFVAFLPNKEGTILDLCCGYGATTRHLLKFFAPQSIVGIVESKSDIGVCKRNAPDTEFLWRRLPNLKLPRDSFDYVICVEKLNRCKQTSALMEEVYRVLRPGGCFVFSALLQDESQPGMFSRLRRRKDLIQKPSDFRGPLEGAGFGDISIVDVTNQCWTPFTRNLQRYLQASISAQEISRKLAHETAAALPGGGEGAASHYVLAAATKTGS